MPVGTPFMRILDHLILALGGGMGVSEGSLNLEVRMALMCGATSWRDAGVAEGPPVTTRLPTAVHLTVAAVSEMKNLAQDRNTCGCTQEGFCMIVREA